MFQDSDNCDSPWGREVPEIGRFESALPVHVPVDTLEMLKRAGRTLKREDGTEVKLGLGFTQEIVFAGQCVRSA